MVDFVILMLIVFSPTIVARCRNLKHIIICFWINLLLGWSIFFWLPLLVYTIFSQGVNKF